jgi:hypothetical protein
MGTRAHAGQQGGGREDLPQRILRYEVAQEERGTEIPQEESCRPS